MKSLAISTFGLQRLAAILSLQEATTANPTADLSHANVRQRLHAALQSDHAAKQKGAARYQSPPWVTDVYGDGKSGTVVSEQDGKFHKRGYTMNDSEAGHSVSFGDPSSVMPRTVYDDMSDTGDQTSPMMESTANWTGKKFVKFGKLLQAYEAGMPSWHLDERNIPQSERDTYNADDFAGKGTSYPIKKKGDVKAAAASIGRAGADNFTSDKLKANIKRIAKKKGMEDELPDSWKESSGSVPVVEAGATGAAGAGAGGVVDLELAEAGTGAAYYDLDFMPIREGAVGQDGTAKICIIKPGWGTSGYYSAEVLERDGPKTFKKGTKMYWDHATKAEEAARPEGSLNNLAATLSSNAYWDKAGKEGPALYGNIGVAKAFRESVDDLAPHIGVSIRAIARGKIGTIAGRTGPIVEGLVRAKSIDFVTEPGAGGKVLQLFESARRAGSTADAGAVPIQQGDNHMDDAVIRELQESNRLVTAQLRGILEAGARTSAADYARAMLGKFRMPAATKERCVVRLRESAPLAKDTMVLDTAAFDVQIKAIAASEMAYLQEAGGTQFMALENGGHGTTGFEVVEEKVEDLEKEMAGIFKGWGLSESGSKVAAAGSIGV